MYKKRGQATILILMGLIILGLVTGVYFTRDYIFKSKLERMSERSLVVPRQAESVKNYVMSCVEQVTSEAVDLVGQRGGYYEVPGDVIPYGPYNKFSNSLEVIPGLKIPYWYYKQANNVEKLQILNLEQISASINNYVNEQLRVCVGDFSVFKREGYKINPGLIKSDVEIQDNKVLFEIAFPIHMEIKDFKFDFVEFYNKVDKPLGELYDIARGIFNYENGKMFLEEKTIDMMVAYDEIPLTGENFECGAVPLWSVANVIRDFKNILSFNIPTFKLKGVDHGLIGEEKLFYEIDIGSVDKNVDIDFMYSGDWPFYLEVLQDEGGLLKGDSVGGNSGNKIMNMVQRFLCYNSWHFVYDIKYPVLIVLEKDDYLFQFAMMVVIDRNEARQNVVVPLNVPTIEDTRFCENKQFNLDVDVYDNYGSAVSDVDVSYKCINHVCDLGKTVGNTLSGLVMPCVGGSVLASKQGYHVGDTQIDTTQDSSVTVEVKKIMNVGVGVEVLRGGAGELKEGETVYISLINEEDEFGASVIYPGQDRVDLIPGNYRANIYMMKEGSISIPGKEVENCVNVPKTGFGALIGQTERKCVTMKIPGVELDNVMTGAVEFDFNIGLSDLRNKIMFYVPYQSTPRSVNDLIKLSSEVDANYKYPKFN